VKHCWKAMLATTLSPSVTGVFSLHLRAFPNSHSRLQVLLIYQILICPVITTLKIWMEVIGFKIRRSKFERLCLHTTESGFNQNRMCKTYLKKCNQDSKWKKCAKYILNCKKRVSCLLLKHYSLISQESITASF
jgi:hypothetical protein